LNNKYNEKIAVLKKIKKQTEDYWGATKELPSNIKFFINTRDYIKNPDKYSKEEIAKAIANRKLILKDIGKGILLPTVGIATSGKTIYTINKLVNNGHNKTAADKNRLTPYQAQLIYDRAVAAIPNKEYEQGIKKTMRLAGLGAILGSAGGYLIGRRNKEIPKFLSTGIGGIIGGTIGAGTSVVPIAIEQNKRLKAEGISQRFMKIRISPEAKKKYYDPYNK
jgi:hypothetical protein